LRRLYIHAAALIIALAFTGAAMKLPQLGADWARLLAYTLLGPGVQVCRWFMTASTATPAARLWIICGVNVLVWWPMLAFFAGAIADGRRFWRDVTLLHVLMAIAIGVGASFLATRLNLIAPKYAGVLTLPATPFDALAAIVSPVNFLRRARLITFFSGAIGYAAIAFVALYRGAWRKTADA
jgi:hypothetical protein